MGDRQDASRGRRKSGPPDQGGAPGGESRGGSGAQQRSGQPSQTSAERAAAWQQVLSQLGGRPGSYDPEQVAELARRAGISDPDQLANVARSFGSSLPSAQVGPGLHLLFQLGETICALPAEVVQGVERVAEVTPVPNTAEWVLGVVQVWGSIVSVVDLQAFLGLPPVAQTAGRGRLMVVQGREMSVGFLIAPFVEMHALGENLAARLDPSAVPDLLRPYARGSVVDGDRMVVVLDPARLLGSEKLRRYHGG